MPFPSDFPLRDARVPDADSATTLLFSFTTLALRPGGRPRFLGTGALALASTLTLATRLARTLALTLLAMPSAATGSVTRLLVDCDAAATDADPRSTRPLRGDFAGDAVMPRAFDTATAFSACPRLAA